MSSNSLELELQHQRRKVDFDTFDIVVQQLITMVEKEDIDIAPAYQRKFRWDKTRCSQLIESLFLGIPVPSLSMATNKDATWELVDGVQRINTIIQFAGNDRLRKMLGHSEPLKLFGLEKLSEFNGLRFSDLPRSMQRQFELRPIKVVTLSDKSDKIVRFDLFERLNRGGVTLTDQEIRACVFRGQFCDFLDKLATEQNFLSVVKFNLRQKSDGTIQETILRFFAFHDLYKKFVHSVEGFLNEYMRDASIKFDYGYNEQLFRDTFLKLSSALPNGIVRQNRKGVTPLILFEGVAVGAALALEKKEKLSAEDISWIDSEELRKVTTGFTNSPQAVQKRIEFCRDRFLGK